MPKYHYIVCCHISPPPLHTRELKSKAHTVFFKRVILINARTFARYHPLDIRINTTWVLRSLTYSEKVVKEKF